MAAPRGARRAWPRRGARARGSPRVALAGPRGPGGPQPPRGGDSRAGRSVADGLVLRTADSTYLLAFDGRGPRHLAGKRVTVTGTHSGNRITVSSMAAGGGTPARGTPS